MFNLMNRNREILEDQDYFDEYEDDAVDLFEEDYDDEDDDDNSSVKFKVFDRKRQVLKSCDFVDLNAVGNLCGLGHKIKVYKV